MSWMAEVWPRTADGLLEVLSQRVPHGVGGSQWIMSPRAVGPVHRGCTQRLSCEFVGMGLRSPSVQDQEIGETGLWSGGAGEAHV